MPIFKVRLKRITYEGTRWDSFQITAESMEMAIKKIEQDYNLKDCLDYWTNVHSDIWMNSIKK